MKRGDGAEAVELRAAAGLRIQSLIGCWTGKRELIIVSLPKQRMPIPRHKERHAFAVPPKASDQLVWLLGRAYLNYVVLLQEQFKVVGLPDQIRPGMGHLLFALFAEDSLTLRDLTARTGLAPSSVTEMVQRMERTGLLSRVRDMADRRSVRVSLTKRARSLEPQLRRIERHAKEVLEDGFDATGARRLRAALARVIRNLYEHLKPADVA